MEEKKDPGIPEGQESEYYAGDIAERHPKPERPSVTVPGKVTTAAGNIWETLRRAVLLVLSLGGAYALTNPQIRDRLAYLFRNFISFTGGH